MWPTMVEEFAGYNAMPRYVLSTTLEGDDPRWLATIARSLEHEVYGNGIQKQVYDVVR